VLDVTSEEFDAEIALRQPIGRVKLPFNIRPLDNISKCRFLLPPKDPNYFSIAMKKTKTTATTSSAQSSSVANIDAAVKNKAPKIPSALDLMTEKFDEGPMSLLKGWLQRRERVKVCIRGVKSIRSWCTGEVRAFDKHFNLLLGNVVEEFVVDQDKKEEEGDSGDDDYSSTLHKKRKAASSQSVTPRRRRVGQMFIKGDGVVLICSAKPNVTS